MHLNSQNSYGIPCSYYPEKRWSIFTHIQSEAWSTSTSVNVFQLVRALMSNSTLLCIVVLMVSSLYLWKVWRRAYNAKNKTTMMYNILHSKLKTEQNDHTGQGLNRLRCPGGVISSCTNSGTRVCTNSNKSGSHDIKLSCEKH